jgi:hypothetical protein
MTISVKTEVAVGELMDKACRVFGGESVDVVILRPPNHSHGRSRLRAKWQKLTKEEKRLVLRDLNGAVDRQSLSAAIEKVKTHQ